MKKEDRPARRWLFADGSANMSRKAAIKKILGVIRKSKADPRVENVAIPKPKSYGTIQKGSVSKGGIESPLQRMDDSARQAFKRRKLK